jgi:ABC-type Fe3+/spermidine/putrescine transport system ATPase subunit
MNELIGFSAGPGSVEVDGRTLPIDSGYPMGTAVTVLVRPEDTRIELSGHPGTVVRVSFQGAYTRISVRMDRLDVLVDVHDHASDPTDLQPGDRTTVAFDWTKARCEQRPE